MEAGTGGWSERIERERGKIKGGWGESLKRREPPKVKSRWEGAWQEWKDENGDGDGEGTELSRLSGKPLVLSKGDGH